MEIEEYTGSDMDRFKSFVTTKGIEDIPKNAGRRKAVLQSVIGNKTYELVRDLLALKRTADKSYLEIVKVLKCHFQSKLSWLVQ